MNLFLDYFTPIISTTYVDVDYEGLHLFRQPDKGISFALKYVSSVYCKIPMKVLGSTDPYDFYKFLC